MTYELWRGDCRACLANMADDSVDSIVSDPPYELGFMGKSWDASGIAYDVELWRECLRVLKPGGHLLAFGGSRTYHRLAVAIEDAGFQIRDGLIWLYGSGFPKSLDVSKAIDKAANAATSEAQQWEGWGTALKPAHEPIVMARKPLVGTVAANVLAHGTGALNIDACRVGVTPADLAEMEGRSGKSTPNQVWGAGIGHGVTWKPTQSGRFPANVAHDGSDPVLAIFPARAGAAAPVTRRNGDTSRNSYGAFAGNIDEAGSTFQGDSGSAARFFYCAKASKADRNSGGVTSTHPTVKPTALMRWLVRLVTPPGGLVFDPFTGSGSTGKAALLGGFRFLGAELTPEYWPIATARLDHAVNESHKAQL